MLSLSILLRGPQVTSLPHLIDCIECIEWGSILNRQFGLYSVFSQLHTLRYLIRRLTLNNSKVQLTSLILLFSRELFCSKSEYQIDDKNYFFTSIIDYFHHRAQNRCVQKICCSIKISLAFLEKKFICRLQ